MLCPRVPTVKRKPRLDSPSIHAAEHHRAGSFIVDLRSPIVVFGEGVPKKTLN